MFDPQFNFFLILRSKATSHQVYMSVSVIVINSSSQSVTQSD